MVDVELDGYFRPDIAEARRALILSRWCDELQDWPVASIAAAFAKWIRENPRLRPNYGDILQLLNKAWGERNADQVRAAMAEQPRHEGMTPEQHAAVSAELAAKFPGLIPGSFNRMPAPRNRATDAEVKAMQAEVLDTAKDTRQ